MWGVLAKISNWISGSNSDHHSSESDRGLTNELKRNMLSVSLPLPEDLVITILSFVPANDLLQNCIYVKEWVHLINSQSLWITKCTNEGIPLPLVKPDPLPENFYRAIYFVPYGANLLKNSCGKDGLNHWAVAGYNDYELSNDDGEGSSHGWTIEDPPAGSDPLPNSDCQSCFSTTYTWCRKRQVVNLLEAVGSYSEVLDIVKPTIEVSEWYAARFDCGSTYRLSVLLLDQHENVIDKFEFSHTEPQWTGKRWEKVDHSFKDYPSGVRYIAFEHSGKDTQFWAGSFGSKMTHARVSFIFDK